MTAHAWELVRCTNPSCSHEYPRERTGRLMLPCGVCGSAMTMLALQIAEKAPDSGGPAGEPFTVADMAGALAAAADSASELAVDPTVRSRDRAMYAGRAHAYQEAADMAAYVILSDHLEQAR